MMLRVVVVASLVGCAGSSLTADQVDNPDALEEIPPSPPIEDRDDREDPYDDDEEDTTPDDPPDEPEDPPDDPIDPQDDPTPTPPPPTPLPPTPPAPTPPPTSIPTPPVTCPQGVTCIASLPYVDSNTTTGGSSAIDSYGCSAATDESGPERVYQLELTEPGFLAVTLFGLGFGVDVDVHLLHSTDPSTCIDRGHWDAASLLDAGTYTVVVDSWVNSSGVPQEGDYSVRFHTTPYDAFVGDGLSTTALTRGLTAFDEAWHNGETSDLVYTVIDFDLPSTTPRLWTFSLSNGDLLFNELVTHGENSSSSSDPSMVGVLSNVNGSHQSSIGLMRAAETYQGSNGYSMRLDGLEPGFNDNVRTRAIVVHEATYATQSFVNTYGYLGRSWGCPAVDPQVNASLIDTVKNGSLFFTNYSDPTWLNNSDYL